MFMYWHLNCRQLIHIYLCICRLKVVVTNECSIEIRAPMDMETWEFVRIRNHNIKFMSGLSNLERFSFPYRLIFTYYLLQSSKFVGTPGLPLSLWCFFWHISANFNSVFIVDWMELILFDTVLKLDTRIFNIVDVRNVKFEQFFFFLDLAELNSVFGSFAIFFFHAI